MRILGFGGRSVARGLATLGVALLLAACGGLDEFPFGGGVGPTDGDLRGRVVLEGVCDGIAGPGDTGLQGIEVLLTLVSGVGGSGDDSTTTILLGSYAFFGLAPGNYRVEVPPGQPALQGLQPSTPTSVVRTVQAGETVDLDFHFCDTDV